jgi:hypothetical protein
MMGNSVKLGIAAVSILYDVILMVRSAVSKQCWCDDVAAVFWMVTPVAMLPQVQHYIVYPEGDAAVLPQLRAGFKPVPADDGDSLPLFIERRSSPAGSDVHSSM